MSAEREMTYGEKAVGLTFNPSGMGDVHELKTLYAKIIDHMDDFRKGYIARGDNPEMVRLCSIAITEAQTAQMWAVKAVTWRPRKGVPATSAGERPMFAVHSPQTITLAYPGEDEPALTINLKTNDADTSRCVMEISDDEGTMFRLVFNTRGNLIDQQYIEPSDDNDADLTDSPNVSAHMVDGRDIRAFDPYTHKPPVDADTAYRDPNPGFRSPQPVDDETRQAAADARQAAAEAAQKARQELIDRANETPEARQERERNEEAERRAKEDERLQKQAEREANAGTTATAKTFPSQETQDLVQGKDMAGNPNPPRQGDPMAPAPAPSSPQPGSPPPHPLSQPDPGRVTTSKDFSGEPAGTSAEQERVETAAKQAEIDRAKRAPERA